MLKNNLKLRIINTLSTLNFKKIITKTIKYSFGLNNFRITCLQIHVTDKCNLNCLYCYAKNHKGKPLTKEKIIRLIDDAKENKVHEIQFVGGEPFLYPDFKEILDYTNKKGLYIRVYTNGTIIDDTWIRFLKKYKKDITIIFKFDSEEGYIEHTTKNLSQKIINNMKKCINNKIPVASFITVTKKNIKYVDALIKKSFEIGSYPIIERYLPTCSKEINRKLEINATEWAEVLELFEEYYKEYMIFYDMVSDLLGFYCSCYVSTMSIDTNGEALPCPYAPKELSLGNVNNTSLSEIFRRYKDKIEEWNKVPEDCTGCESSKECNGGCKTHVFLKDRKMGGKDPLCKDCKPPTMTMASFNNKTIT